MRKGHKTETPHRSTAPTKKNIILQSFQKKSKNLLDDQSESVDHAYRFIFFILLVFWWLNSNMVVLGF